MSIQTVDFIESFLAGINFNTFVDSHTDDGTNTTLTVREMFYARAGLTIAVDGTDYVILSVDYTLLEIVVVGVIASPQIALLQPVKYFHGTPLAVTGELNAIPMTSGKAPLLYVYEMIPEDYNHEIGTQLDRTASVKMVFLDDSSSYNTTDEHYSSVITPISNLVNKFIDELLSARGTFVRSLVDRSRRLNHVYFGTYSDSKGHERKIFNDIFTGIELDIDLPFSKVSNCLIAQPNICYPATITDSDGVTTFEVASNGSGACTLASSPPSGIAYNRVITNCADTSYSTGDDAYLNANSYFDWNVPSSPASVAQIDYTSATPMLTLTSNNAFGNLNRFTDDAGGQTYTSNYVIDHLTGIGIYRILNGAVTWATALSNALASTQNGFNDWYIPTASHMTCLMTYDRSIVITTSKLLSYVPLSISGVRIWTSSTRYASTTNALLLDNELIAQRNKTFTGETLYIRNHY